MYQLPPSVPTRLKETHETADCWKFSGEHALLQSNNKSFLWTETTKCIFSKCEVRWCVPKVCVCVYCVRLNWFQLPATDSGFTMRRRSNCITFLQPLGMCSGMCLQLAFFWELGYLTWFVHLTCGETANIVACLKCTWVSHDVHRRKLVFFLWQSPRMQNWFIVKWL